MSASILVFVAAGPLLVAVCAFAILVGAETAKYARKRDWEGFCFGLGVLSMLWVFLCVGAVAVSELHHEAAMKESVQAKECGR